MKKMYMILCYGYDETYGRVPVCYPEVYITDADNILKIAKEQASDSLTRSVRIHEARINKENGQIIPGKFIEEVK